MLLLLSVFAMQLSGQRGKLLQTVQSIHGHSLGKYALSPSNQVVVKSKSHKIGE